ncbi:MAG: alpha-glucan family phosphorylase [Chloroflexi bacterium]|nr:alpha-glucan family phosphorylase [Chloroflexota bacterium]
MIRPSRVFTVVPTIPPALAVLKDLAYNLRWTWDHQTADLFRRLDPARWEATNHNPVLLLRTTDQVRLNEAARDPAYRRELAGAAAELAAYMDGDGADVAAKPRVAYFSAEFGLSECLPIYSGGLGVLSGDHLKSASDLNLNLTAISLYYRHGYFVQRLRPDGWQEEQYVDNDPATLPVTPALGPDGEQIRLELGFPGRDLHVLVWQVQVGRITLYLLDTDLEENQPADRAITGRLYGGDRDMRIRQELLLGIGGLRVLDIIGKRPEVCHLNEGHSAFLTLERIRQLMNEQGLSFDEARAVAAAGMVFTTHTPVAAGHDAFEPGTIDYYLGDYYRELGLSRSEFMALGRLHPQDESEPFSMTILALRLTARSNGVSILHGDLSRRLWGGVWPGLAEEEVPTGSITNGVHLRTWLAPEFTDLYENMQMPAVWTGALESSPRVKAVDEIPARDLWDRHERLRDELVHFVRARLASQLARQNAGPAEVARAVEALNGKTLTIGFARRFAEYKRAALLLRDPDRLIRLVTDPKRPVQFVFGGKAHPHDNGGKELLRQLFEISKREELRGRIVVLEEYDIGVARRMVQGVDVWLNTPRRPLEASGTSGMKATANGAIHVGTLDGWWDEAYRAGLGWAIGDRRHYDDPNFQDHLESNSLYDLLERELVPTFYDRDANDLPQGWIAKMRASMGGLTPIFNTDRMVSEYLNQYYAPAAEDFRTLSADGFAPTREVAAWVARVREEWPNVTVVDVQGLSGAVAAGTTLDVVAEVALGGLKPDEVEVHLATGLLDSEGVLSGPRLTVLDRRGAGPDDTYRFGIESVSVERSGRHGFAVRVVPRHPSLPIPFPLGLVRWSD